MKFNQIKNDFEESRSAHDNFISENVPFDLIVNWNNVQNEHGPLIKSDDVSCVNERKISFGLLLLPIVQFH